MTPFVVGGAGFLLAVLWFDLMFDLQVLRRPRPGRPETREVALASVAAYYRRVTSGARPMNRLVGVVMLGTLASIGAQLGGGTVPAWVAITSLLLAGGPVALAAVRIYPEAVRLGRREDGLEVQARRARRIGRDHLVCLAAILGLLVIQLSFGR